MYTAIIVEPREHKALPFVIKNALDNLSNDWNVIIFHGNKNIEFVNSIVHGLERITTHNLNVDNLQRDEYSRLLMDRKFYDHIPTEMFLVFQTDSMIFEKNKDRINDFLKYDYVGAPWKHHQNQVGNGGFSLRRKSKMIEIIEKEPKPQCPHFPEDFFFSFPRNVSLYKPSYEEAKYFAFESEFYTDCFGSHQPWLVNNDTVLEHYPEAVDLFILNGIIKL
jgi:hypothetical protein